MAMPNKTMLVADSVVNKSHRELPEIRKEGKNPLAPRVLPVRKATFFLVSTCTCKFCLEYCLYVVFCW